MKKLQRVSALVAAGMTLTWASGPSHALGFGRPFSRAVLGDTLSVTVPLRLESGEEINDDCLAADVYFGDEKVSSSAVKAMLQTAQSGEQVLKVSTTALINEPVVTVYLAAGCQVRMTRKFVAFADPPGMIMPSVGESVPVDVAEVSEPTETARPRRAATASKANGRRAVAQASSARSARRDESIQSEPQQAPVMSARAARVAPEPEGDVRPSQRAEFRSEQTLGAAKRAESPADGAGGRLELDVVAADPLELPDLRMTASLGVMLQANDQSPEVLARRRTAAALWLALNATPDAMARDQQRISELEQRLAQLSADNERHRKALAESGGLGKWLALMALIAAAAVGVAVYLGRQLKVGRKGRDAWWHSQADGRQQEPTAERTAEPTAGMATTTAFSQAPDLLKAAPAAAGAAAARKVAAPPAVFQPQPQPVKQKSPDVAPDAQVTTMAAALAPANPVSQPAQALREVSVEELIDLEQQAEFFVVLGQDDAAISLLESHMAHTTGASPLPLLKLLEILRRLDRRDDYERVQMNFQQRFDAHAPAWDADPQQGRNLADFPGVVERLQGLWDTPAKAMELLEKLLTRPDSSIETFDLPAYRELLFLYAVARDLGEREQHDRANVDLLLPAVDGAIVVDDDSATTASNGLELEDSGEQLMSTRPVKAQPDALPSLNLDFHLDDMAESAASADAKDLVKH